MSELNLKQAPDEQDVHPGHAGATSLHSEYIHRVCTGWLRFSSAISLGPREADEPAMPGANRIGGADAIAWRRAHAGFVEIELDFPEEMNGMAGVALGRMRVASGPGAARILRQSGRMLGELPVYRRLWLGSHRRERAPDVVIGPEHRLEVNAGSSLLAAIAMGSRGRLDAVAGEGRGEEAERVRLLDKRARSVPAAARQPGPLGGVVADYPMPTSGERTEEDERRLVTLDTRRRLRAAAAQRGAAALWSWVGAVTTDKIRE